MITSKWVHGGRELVDGRRQALWSRGVVLRNSPPLPPEQGSRVARRRRPPEPAAENPRGPRYNLFDFNELGAWLPAPVNKLAATVGWGRCIDSHP